MAIADPVLQIRNLAVSYRTRRGDVPAVADFSLDLRAGETVGLVGESGCGKSTVAYAIMGYLGRNGRIAGGSVRFRDMELTTLDAAGLRRVRAGGIAMIYQEPMNALNPALTIGRQLAEVPMTHEGIDERTARKRATELLAAVDLPEPARILDSYPHQISGGQQQRVVIAMALLARPAVLLLDEPTTALDVTVEAGIVELIGRLSRRFGTANLYISHNLGLIRETCDRVAVMYSGAVVEEGTVDAVFRQMRHPYTRGLFAAIPLPAFDKRMRGLRTIPGHLPPPQERPPGCAFAPRCDFAQAGLCNTQPVALEETATAGHPAHRVRCVRWRALPPPGATAQPPGPAAEEIGEPILQIDNLSKSYPVASGGAVVANDGVSLTARRGETVAIVGESGCGKSTLARIVLGLETATGGSVRFLGDEVATAPVESRRLEQRAALQMVFQNPHATLNPSRSVGRQIARTVRKLADQTSSAAISARVTALLRMVRLSDDVRDLRPRQLSGGQKQRIAIARAFAGTPALVVADEAVSALDVSVQAAVTELLLDVQREHGTALLFISHDLAVVRYLADRVAVMYLGQIAEHGSTDQVFAPPYHPYTEALLAAVPLADPGIDKRRIVLDGPPADAAALPPGCRFANRCPRKLGTICDTDSPPRRQAAPGHSILCHIPLEDLRRVPPVFRSRREAASAADDHVESRDRR